MRDVPSGPRIVEIYSVAIHVIQECDMGRIVSYESTDASVCCCCCCKSPAVCRAILLG